MWQRGLLNLIDLEGRYIGIACFYGVPMYSFLDTSESDVLGASRCIRNVWFYAHTSEMSDVRPVRCIVTLVSVGDTSGLRFQCPSRCTEVQIYIYNTSGWANIGYSRCIAKKLHIEIHRYSSIHNNPDVSKSSIHRKSKFSSNPDVFKLISREYTCSSSKSTPAQADFNTKIHRNSTNYRNPDVFQLISRDYTHFPIRRQITAAPTASHCRCSC